jgi:hypothetical protein
MDVGRRAKAGRVLVLDDRDDAAGVALARLHGHAEVAQVDDSPFTRAERVGLQSHHDEA